MKLEITEATAADAEGLAALHARCFPHYWNSKAFTDFFAVAGTKVLMVSGERPVESKKESSLFATGHPLLAAPFAMLVYRVQHEEAEILTLAVHPAHRRQGLASALVKQVMQASEKIGVERILLDVEDGNKAALTLYESFGFCHVRRRKQYYRQKDGSFTDALVMMRKL